MSSRKTWVAGLFILALASAPPAWAQIPGVGAAPGGASGAASAGLGAAGATGLATPAAAAPAASPTTLWSFLGLSGSNMQACKAKLCNSQIGLMLNSMATGPVGAMTGGLIPPLCPPPSAAQIAALQAQSPGGAEATAAKIKASEADAKARVAAVEYLATVDCTRWKEATKALVNALRADPNECVRFAAARALNSGCCCNKQTIEALKICVAGEDSDGNPPETSPRVKAAAFNALQNCLMRVPEVLPDENPKIERERGPNPLPEPLGRERSTMIPADGSHIAASHIVKSPGLPSFEDQLKRKTYAQTVNEARQALFQVARAPKQPTYLAPGRKSVFDLFIKARQDINTKARSSANATANAAPYDASVAPASSAPGFSPSQGEAATTPAAAPGSMSSAPSPSGPVTSNSSTEPNRGLVGLLFNSHR